MFFKRVKSLLYECGLIYLLCHYFTYINPWKVSLLSLPTIIAVLLVINILFYIVKMIFGVKIKSIYSQQARYHNIITKVMLFILSVLLVITSIQYVLLLSKEKGKEKGALPRIISFLPATQTSFPISQIRKSQYVRDIKKHKQKPLEYVVQLFENHDIVVLCERRHTEYTQWQLFSEIILNDDFASKIGNVATEFGRINVQKQLDSLLNRSFQSEEEKRKSFASLIRENGGMWSLWDNSNIFDFAINLSEFNEKQGEKQKINWFFCDVAGDWNNINSRQDWENNNFSNFDRDRIMATNIATVFDNLDNSKLLVIVNTHHAYKENDQTTADYLHQQYGEKVAFVWINNISQKSSSEMFSQPYQMGILDAAASQIKDSVWAISFSESLLGEDNFELLPHRNKWHLKMKDLFNGMIYCFPPSKHYQKYGYEYILSDFEDTLLKRNQLVLGDEKGIEITNREINDYQSGTTYTWIIPYFFFFNLVYYVIHFFILIYLFFYLISILKKKSFY